MNEEQKDSANGKRLMTIEELAEFLNVTKKSIYDLVYTKRIPYTKIGNRLRFQVELIHSWIESKTHLPFGLKILYTKPTKVEGEGVNNDNSSHL